MINLDQCELLEEKRVTDVYEYSIGKETGSYQIPDGLTFDADGNFRLGTVSSGNVVYIPVIHQDGSGDLTGRLYRVPEPLTLQEFNSVEPSVSQNTQEETAYYSDTLSLSDCELLEGKSMTEKFAYTIGPGTHVYKVSELTPFNDKGDCVVGIAPMQTVVSLEFFIGIPMVACWKGFIMSRIGK